MGQLGSTDDAKITADATSPGMMNKERENESVDGDKDGEDEASLDDFLLDLGLDSLGDDDDDTADDDDDTTDDDDTEVFIDDVEQVPAPMKASTKSTSGVARGLEDVMFTENDEDDNITEEEDVNSDGTASIDDDDDDLGLGLDEEDDLDDSMEVPLEDLGDDNNDLGSDNFFDDGGFDYDDGDGDGGFDGGFD